MGSNETALVQERYIIEVYLPKLILDLEGNTKAIAVIGLGLLGDGLGELLIPAKRALSVNGLERIASEACPTSPNECAGTLFFDILQKLAGNKILVREIGADKNGLRISIEAEHYKEIAPELEKKVKRLFGKDSYARIYHSFDFSALTE